MIHSKTCGLAARRPVFVLTLVAAALGCLAALLTYQKLSAAAAQPASQKASPQQKLLYHNNIAIALMEQFNFREALGELAQCLKIESKFVPALVNSALAHFYLQEFPQAEEYLKKAIAIDPAQPNALFALGMIYRNQNQMEEALASFRKILAADPQDPPTLYQAGQIYLKQQKYGEAVETLRKVVELSPYDIAAHYNLATALIRKGDQVAGQKMMETFTRLREKGGISNTGTQYGEQGQYMLAIGEYTEIKSIVKELPPARHRPIQFVNVTEAAGIRFVHGAQGPASISIENLVSAMGSGAAFCDYDKDGALDLYLANASSDQSKSHGALYRNDGKGRFENVTEKAGIRATGLGMGAYWGDLNNDGHADLFLTKYGTNQLYLNSGDGTFVDVTEKSGLGRDEHWHLSGALSDVDHDGDLDIFVGNYWDTKQPHDGLPGATVIRDLGAIPGGACHLYRNNGDGTFTDIANEARVKLANESISSVVFTDFDNRRDIDFWVASERGGSHLYSNERVGTFLDVIPKDLAMNSLNPFSVSVGDYNKDGWMDFAVTRHSVGGTWLVRNLGSGKFDQAALLANENLPAKGSTGWMSHFFDYDNDGDVDLFLVNGGQSAADANSKDAGPELWENQGNSKFINVTSKTALSREVGKPYRSATFGDYDNDGDTDVLLTVNGGSPVLLRNDGGNENNWIKVRLQGTNSNKSGIGTKVEVKSGALWQKVEVNGGSGYLSQSPPEVIFGLGSLRSVDALRLLWPGGVLQSEINLPVNQAKLVQELDRKGTSCPLLYTWNGAKYQFVTDFLGGCAIGYLLAPGQYNTPDTDEYVRVTDSQLKLRDGRYSLRMNNQLEEVLFIDETKLVAVDHPASIELFPNERLLPGPPFPEFKLFAAQNARPPKAAWDQQGRDVLPLIARIDRDTPQGFKLLPFKGYAEEHSLTLDLGDIGGAVPLQLLMTAWIDYADSTANFKASQTGVKLAPPYLQAKTKRGEWETVIPNMGFPAGLTKTMVVDLTGRLPEGSHEVRIVTNMRIYWDQILVNRFAGVPNHSVHRLSPASAELRYVGFPREYSPDGKRPLIYDYDWIDPVAPWKSHVGDYTRFGDVRPLLGDRDDRYVIMRNGDEIQIDFAASLLPELPMGWKRTFLFYADGFGKDMDLHSAASDTVAPLPFHGMSKYPYVAPEKYPDTSLHRRYQQEYNTRHVPEELSELHKR